MCHQSQAVAQQQQGARIQTENSNNSDRSGILANKMNEEGQESRLEDFVLKASCHASHCLVPDGNLFDSRLFLIVVLSPTDLNLSL
jgi:hypothetical protein